MQFPSLIGHAAQLYKLIKKSNQSAESLASEYFRSKKYIGSKERKFLSELVFASLRTSSLIDYISDHILQSYPLQQSDYQKEIFACLSTCIIGNNEQYFTCEYLIQPAFGCSSVHEGIVHTLMQKADLSSEAAALWIDNVCNLYQQLSVTAEQYADGLHNDIDTFSIICCMPKWIIESFQQSKMNNRSILTLCKSLYKSATVGIRVNSLAISKEAAFQIMQQYGIQCREGQYAPDAIILLERVKLQDFPLYMNGSIEIQDEGSQLISLALNPESDWRILDYCAGAGGKTLHLAAMQQDQGEIISTDIEFSRLRELHFRSEKAQLRSIHLISMQSKSSKDKKQKPLSYYIDTCDAVLVDAPCTGMGTVRRMPMIKWRLEPKHVQKIVEKQSDILQKASEFVKPGGILIYATCSLLKEENGDIVQSFLQKNPDFLPDSLYHAYPQKTIEALGITETQCDLSLFPSIHGTDGFFVSRMRRNA